MAPQVVKGQGGGLKVICENRNFEIKINGSERFVETCFWTLSFHTVYCFINNMKTRTNRKINNNRMKA